MKKLVKKIKKPSFRKKRLNIEEAISQAPRITNETVSEHREEVLSSARKYIYPLQHSKHRIVFISTSIFIAIFIGFFTYTTLALYKMKSYSTFLYRVTQVLPFPVAKAGSDYVAYENYLFELKHYIHFYKNQQKLDFNNDAGKQQLEDFKKRALDIVVGDAYVKQLAERNDISVSDREVDDEITLIRNQNRIGGNEQAFKDTLKESFGWSVDDFRRTIKQQLLAKKVVAKLDTATSERAKAAIAELQAGADFAAVAKKYSDEDATKDSGGEFGVIAKNSADVSPQTVQSLFALQQGSYSSVFQSDDLSTGRHRLEIVKNLENQGDKIKGAHIVFTFKDINDYVNDLKDREKARLFIKL